MTLPPGPPQGVVPEANIAPLVGAFIGAGKVRKVYELVGFPDWVVKKGIYPPNSSNRTEWDIWNEVVGTKLESLFARCAAISYTGRYLIMERLADLTDADLARIPDLPIWLTDYKRSALGKTAAGDIKVRDYGNIKPCDDRINAPLVKRAERAPTDWDRDILRRLREIKNAPDDEAT